VRQQTIEPASVPNRCSLLRSEYQSRPPLRIREQMAGGSGQGGLITMWGCLVLVSEEPGSRAGQGSIMNVGGVTRG
jgi:hypothetical protein